MITLAINSIGAVGGACVGDGLQASVVSEHVDKMKKRNLSAIDTYQVTSLETLVLVVAGFGSNGCCCWGTSGVPLDGRKNSHSSSSVNVWTIRAP